MRRVFLVAILFCLFLVDAFAINWGKMIEFGTGIYVNLIRRTSDGGMILSMSQRNVAKLNKNGNLEWQKSGIFQAVENPDGGNAAIGENNGSWFLTKFNNAGNIIWQKTYAFEATGSVVFMRLRAVGSKGYILAGSEFNRAGPRKTLLLRTDSQGNPLWLKKYPGFNLRDMESVSSEGFILIGRPATRRAPNEPNQNLFILQLNNNGIFQFADYFGGTPSEFGVAIATADNHFAIAGSTIAADSGDAAGFVMKFPRHENGGSFCTFFKDYEQPFKTSFVTPPPPIIPKTQIVENPQITSHDTSVPISDANLEFSDLCN